MIRELTLREFFQQTYAPLKLTASSEPTRDQYRVALNHLHRSAGRDVGVSELTDDLVAECMAGLIKLGRSPAMVNKTRIHLLAIWRYAKRRGLIAELPDVDRVREPKRVPKAWTINQIAAILHSARQEAGLICEIAASHWWQALLSVLYDTGLRISATMVLQWDGFDEHGRTLLVPAETQKQNADQLPALSDDSIDALLAIRGPRPLIFPWPYDRGGPQWPTLCCHLRRILARAGLPTTRKDLFHKFRKTHASYIKRAGGDPTEQLGHSSQQVTAAYLDPQICRRRRQVDLLPRPKVFHHDTDPQMRLF